MRRLFGFTALFLIPLISIQASTKDESRQKKVTAVRITGQITLVDADSLVMRQGDDRSTFTLLDMRSLERDGGYATPLDRIRRGGKWGFLLSVIGVAVTAAVEEFQGLGDRTEVIPDNSVRKTCDLGNGPFDRFGYMLVRRAKVSGYLRRRPANAQ